MHRSLSLAICLACTPVPPCDTLAVEPCAERAECTTITAWTVTGTDEEACVDYDAARVAVGCMEAGVGCDDIVVRSTDPNDPDASYLFSSACLPSGWQIDASEDLPQCAL